MAETDRSWMRLLFLTSLLPDEVPATGYEIATAAIVAGLRETGAEVTVAGFARPGRRGGGTKNEIVFDELVIENAAVGRVQKARWLAKALVESLPVSAAKLRTHSRPALLRKIEAAGRFDGVVLNSIQLPTAYPFLSDLGPSIFVAHNVEHVSAFQNARGARDPLERLLFEREAKLLKRAEARLCERAAVVMTLAEEDLDPLGLSRDAKALSLPLPIGRSPVADAGTRQCDVGLIGTWSWAPNRVGLEWFLEAVVPKLPADLAIAIAGQFDGAPPAAPPQVCFEGRVPDAQAFVRSSRVLALATRGGTGVQLKTIEALEEGMPVVATSPALRGISRPLPENVRIADDPDAFAAALSELVEAERAGRELRINGQAFAEGQRLGLHAALSKGLAILREGASPHPADAEQLTLCAAGSRC